MLEDNLIECEDYIVRNDNSIVLLKKPDFLFFYSMVEKIEKAGYKILSVETLNFYIIEKRLFTDTRLFYDDLSYALLNNVITEYD